MRHRAKREGGGGALHGKTQNTAEPAHRQNKKAVDQGDGTLPGGQVPPECKPQRLQLQRYSGGRGWERPVARDSAELLPVNLSSTVP